jgi:O-antigen/teichoic acid export membrane protein
MLLGQTAINFAANVFSAAFGLINVVIFTRLFAPAEFGVYVLGAGFAAIASTFMVTWLRLPIMREQARGDGTDVRGIVVPGLLLSCATGPVAYGAAKLAGLTDNAAIAAVGLALAIGVFETSQELLRARLQAFTVMRATMIRAVLVPALGVAFAMADRTGVLLIMSSTLAHLVAALAVTRDAWRGAAIRFDGARLVGLAKAGMPLTLSLTLLAMSSVIDRFIIAYLIGPAEAGQYTAGVDLVRQSLIIPAISVSAAFFPMSVQILANRGNDAVRVHLDECYELLLAIVLPACLGFAIAAPHIANVILGAEFRSVAIAVMPIVSVAVIFQILSYQYLHVSFLLSGRNAFFLLNTGSVLVFNAVLSYVLIVRFGAVGAAWGRLAAELFGFASALLLVRWAFPVPLSGRRFARVLVAAVVMAVIVRGTDLALAVPDRDALVILLPVGIVSYVTMCWFLDVARTRDHVGRALQLVRDALPRKGKPLVTPEKASAKMRGDAWRR